ncbi:MAG: hypothetical protein COB37_05275 [Kordiimonadales bacterium]|nr:MAG: hypothetical protein COB37_05275 [Kordiimonadales bacterium]
MKHLLTQVTAIVFLCAFSAHASNTASNKVPLATFAAKPDLRAAELSPNGEKIAFIARFAGKDNIVFQNLDGTNGVLVRTPEQLDVENFIWANDTVIIMVVGGLRTWGALQSTRKVPRTTAFSYDLITKEYTWLGAPDRRGIGRKGFSSTERLSQYETIFDRLPNDHDHILMKLDFGLDASKGIYKVNIRTGRRGKALANIDGISNWYADQSSVLRIGFGKKGRKRDRPYGVYKDADGTWITIKELAWRKEYKFEGLTSDPKIIFVKGLADHGRDALYKLDISSGEILEKTYQREAVDVGTLQYDAWSGAAIGISYTEEFRHVKYFDKGYRTVQKTMNKALKGATNSIVGHNPTKNLYLISSRTDRNPGHYYLYDRANKALTFIAETRAGIDPNTAGSTRGVTIPVRDGTEITAFLTTPSETVHKALPTIVIPHSTLSTPDNAEWDYLSQFYASRGYLVLRPNYRGSKGYGDAFLEQGSMQWSGLMQDDITDATKWLINKGLADPDRICIVGISYGGYAALMGTIKEPSLYKCTVSVNGAVNIPRLRYLFKTKFNGDPTKTDGTKRSRDDNAVRWLKHMGLDGYKDKEISPYHRAREINVPVLLMSSKDDFFVPFHLAATLDRRLGKLKKNSKYVRIDIGSHLVTREDARLTFLKETEKFLAQHIGD